MKITVIGSGNSGLAMAAHLSQGGNRVTLWNRTTKTISKLMKTKTVFVEGVINEIIPIHNVTDDIEIALKDTELILITTPATSHSELAKLIGKTLKHKSTIILNPGRTFGAIEFESIFKKYNETNSIIAETQTIIYTCRKLSDDRVNIITLKNDVLLSAKDSNLNESIIDYFPSNIKKHFVPAKSIIETSIGNVGMILHCAPLLLNAGWTEAENTSYKYYYDGITPTIAKFISQIDHERIEISKKLGFQVESTKEWLERSYNITGLTLYECIQNNESYRTIEAPNSLNHRYIFEDVSFGLVPLEAIGSRINIETPFTTLTINLACHLLGYDFRQNGRNLSNLAIQI